MNVQRNKKLAFEEKEKRQADHTSPLWPFFVVLWYWVILDESHLLRKWDRRRPGKLVQATLELDKKHGLCLTGTPMQVSCLLCESSPNEADTINVECAR